MSHSASSSSLFTLIDFSLPTASKFAPVYDLARSLSYPHLTMHSGEEGPASWVRETVFDLGVNRVDHGVHAADDDALLDELAARKTFLTLCPLSNVRLRVHTDVKESPIPKLLEKGVGFSINSDDPAYFGGALASLVLLTQTDADEVLPQATSSTTTSPSPTPSPSPSRLGGRSPCSPSTDRGAARSARPS